MFLEIYAGRGPTHWFVYDVHCAAEIPRGVPEEQVPRTLCRCSAIEQSPHSLPSIPWDPGTSSRQVSFPQRQSLGSHFTSSGSAFLCGRVPFFVCRYLVPLHHKGSFRVPVTLAVS